MERGFRVGDRVSVHSMIQNGDAVLKGRVICTDRKHRYGESVIVLYDLGESEMMCEYMPDGRRFIARSYIKLGWPK